MRNIDKKEVITNVQEAAPYCDEIDFKCDGVMIYGFPDAENKVKEWKKHGYVPQVMVGFAWGEYQDYLNKLFDGEDHHDEAQMRDDLKIMDHGKVANTGMTTDYDIPYMNPALPFVDYLVKRIKPLIDLGVRHVFFEEPELFTSSGYSEEFRRQWKLFYNEEWEDPRASENAHYKASKLKQYLYERAFRKASETLKDYTIRKYGESLEIYGATHPPLNYAQWTIVSPESRLVEIPTVDGVIGQTWSDSIRLPNNYRGVYKYGESRAFETALLDYSSTVEMTRGSNKKTIVIHDAVQDDKSRTWSDYRGDYFRSVAASLLYPDVWHYELSPWPNRVMTIPFASDDRSGLSTIPEDYRRNLLSLFNLYRDMKRDDCSFLSENTEAGILFGDTAMYQRMYPKGSGLEHLSENITYDAFYGMALPLVKHGMALRTTIFENVLRFSDYLDRYKTLFVSYEFLKPASKMHNILLVNWIKEGGNAFYVGDGSDTYHNIDGWWKKDYNTPAEHLFEACGLGKNPDEGLYEVGKGHICIWKMHPAKIAENAEICDTYLNWVESNMKKVGTPWNKTPWIALKRGPYIPYGVFDETEIAKDVELKGTYVDFFTADLKIVKNPILKVGTVGLLYDLSYHDMEPASLVAVTGRSDDIQVSDSSLSFKVSGTLNAKGNGLILCKTAPKKVECDIPLEWKFDEETKTASFTFGETKEQFEIKFIF